MHCVGTSGLNGDLLPVLIMCRLVLCNMSHLFCAVKTKGAVDECAGGLMKVAVGALLPSVTCRADVPQLVPPHLSVVQHQNCSPPSPTQTHISQITVEHVDHKEMCLCSVH